MARTIARKPVTKSTVKSTAKSAPASRRRVPASAKAVAAPVKVSARSVYLASLGAANRAQERATEAVGQIAKQATRVTGLTSKTADKIAKQASSLVKGVVSDTVKEGQKIQSSAYATAQEQAKLTAAEISAFAKRSQETFEKNVTKTTKSVKANVEQIKANAMQGVANLEQVFETRVARTLNTFGVPSAHDVRELQARMADLQKALNQLNRARA